MATKKRTDTSADGDQADEKTTAEDTTTSGGDAPRVVSTTTTPEPEATPAPTSADRPVQARVPYPHSALVVPGGGWEQPGQVRGDLTITRVWTAVPADQVERVKATARRSGLKLAVLVPDNDSKEG